MSWYPYDRQSVEEPREPGRLRRWWWRHLYHYIGPVPVPGWLYYLTPDWIHRLAGSLEEKYRKRRGE